MTDTQPLFAFFGTPALAVRVLERLEAHGYLPALVVTAPDKPRGRGLAALPAPAARWARERDIDVATPASLRDAAFVAELANTPWDVFLVAAYGKLIPRTILDLPRHGCLNVHPSLLPKFRGPSPITSAILADERQTGVTVMQMSEELDEGPIVAAARIELEEAAWPPKGSLLEELLATEGGDLLAETLPPYLRGEIKPQPQDDALATYTRKFSDADARVDLIGDPRENFLKIRAFDTNPRAYFLTPAGKRVIIAQAHYTNGALELERVIPEGKREMAYADFLRGQR